MERWVFAAAFAVLAVILTMEVVAILSVSPGTVQQGQDTRPSLWNEVFRTRR